MVVSSFEWWKMRHDISVMDQSINSVNLCLYELGKTGISNSWTTKVLNLDHDITVS